MFPVDRWPLAERYAASLAVDGVVRGLIGPREVPRLWDRHLLNCAVMADALPAEPHTVADVGSGAGLPGIVLAIRRPDIQVTLIEPLLRRTTYLQEIADELGLDNVEVLRARAEEVHGERSFDVVTSRAVAALDKLLGWSMPLVRRGGELVAMKGSRAADEVAESGSALRRWSAERATVETFGAGVVDPPTTVVRVVRTKCVD
ncbi:MULTISPECIES: 16S rRNA (guanine(527)-N(7))-methyltransferase RsmG [unclassified Nocardioides]|uniref:16S rRNA (guanine(527)-N(7))-methyltransferase RsmG n=1 Tax=unclassified Nocardioides TaxID=2615069 RepID=UPI002407566B|nr:MULTISPECIES: 16S rRNA (guanine(527)-N(7))-methyltransferase RsmG [unclassified Nocardioides]